jgi:phosphomannomutase
MLHSLLFLLLLSILPTFSLHAPLTNLLSGSDIRGEVGVLLTTDATFRIGRSLGRILKTPQTPSPLCIIGHDPRLHGEELVFHFTQGLSSVGVNVHLCKSVTTTPSMFYAVTTSKYDASVMVTASHLPAHKNGYKIFVRDSKYKARCLEKGEVKALLEDADVDNDYSEDEKDDRDDVTIPTLQTVLDFVPIYQSQLIETFRKRTCRIRPLKKLKVMLSTGHGSGFIVSRTFQELGANVVEVRIDKGVNNSEWSQAEMVAGQNLHTTKSSTRPKPLTLNRAVERRT